MSFRLYNKIIMTERLNNIDGDGHKCRITAISNAQIMCVSDFIEENISHQIPLFSLCQLVNVSESTLVKSFKLAYDKTPRSYIESVRIARAAKLLLTSKLTLAEIAYRTGFTHQSRFGVVFKKYYGMTPLKFRTKKQASRNIYQ